MSDVAETGKKGGWLSRLRDGLAKSTKRVTESITGLFTKKKLDQQTLDELEDALIQADLGVAAATRIRDAVGKGRYEGRGVNARTLDYYDAIFMLPSGFGTMSEQQKKENG